MAETIWGIDVLLNATAVHVRDQLLEREEENFGLSKCSVELDGHAQLITVLFNTEIGDKLVQTTDMKNTYLQYLVKFDKVPQDDIAMRLQHGKCNEEDHPVCVIICPQNLPQTENILE